MFYFKESCTGEGDAEGEEGGEENVEGSEGTGHSADVVGERADENEGEGHGVQVRMRMKVILIARSKGQRTKKMTTLT